MITSTQAICTIFGVPDSVTETSEGLVIAFGCTQIHVFESQKSARPVKGGAFKVEASLSHGKWIATSVISVGDGLASGVPKHNAPTQSTLQTTVAAKSTVSSSGANTQGFGSGFAVLSRTRPGAHSARAQTNASTNPASSGSAPSGGGAVVRSMFTRGDASQSQPAEKPPAPLAVAAGSRPRFNLNADESIDMDIPF